MRIEHLLTKAVSVFVGGLSDAECRHHLSQLSCLMLGVFLILHATFRGARSDLDAFAYIDWYESLRNIDWRGFVDGVSGGIYFDIVEPHRFEVGFASIAFLCVKFGFGPEEFFFVCAAVSIYPKVFAISKYSLSPLSTLAWYVSWYYVLFEMNAIRVGIASAALIMGLRHILSGNLLRFIPFVLVASLFHVSAIAGLLLIVVSWVRIDARLIVLMVAVSMVLSFLPIVEVLEPLFVFNAKMREHFLLLKQSQVYSTINVFNAITLGRLAILGALLYASSYTKWSDIEQVGLWAMGLSLSIYFSLASFPVVAGRLSQLIGMFQIFATSALLRGFSPKSIPRIVFILLVIFQFYALVFYSRLADFFYFSDITWLRFPLAIHP